MAYFIEFQPQEINLLWSILLEGKVNVKDAPVMTALMKNIQETVQSQDEALKFSQQLEQSIADGTPLPGTQPESPEVEVEKAD